MPAALVCLGRLLQGRIESIPKVFNEAAQDLGKPGVDADVVLAVWDRIAPGAAVLWRSGGGGRH